MPRYGERGFIWVGRRHISAYVITIDDVDYTDNIVACGDCEFTKNVCPDIGGFKFNIFNATGQYSNFFSGGETVKLYLDFGTGTTKVFEGKLERVENVFGQLGYTVYCEGSHITGELLDITVTESYSGDTLVHNILIDLISTYLTGYTSTNVATTFTQTPNISWQNKQFWDAVNDLCNIAEADCYVDEDKDFHFFPRNSITTTTEAAVYNKNLISIDGLGTDNVEIKNKITVYGRDDDGNPVIYTAQDSDSQTTYGVKEKIIRDETIKTYNEAQDRAEAELESNKTVTAKGKVSSLTLPSLNPGEKMYVVSPIQLVHDAYRVASFTHKFPNETTVIEFEQTRNIPKLFKERYEKELALEDISNINSLSFSYNFPFNDNSNMNTVSSSANLVVSDGQLRLSSGTTATFISTARSTTIDITMVEVRASGENLSNSLFYVSTDGSSWESVALNTPQTLVTTGNKIYLKITMSASDCTIDNAIVLYG